MPASFLRPVHAQLSVSNTGWTVTSSSGSNEVVARGTAGSTAELSVGTPIRLSDGIGNFITLEMTGVLPALTSRKGLQTALPTPGSTISIGRSINSDVRLDHPLVRDRHASLQRNRTGDLVVFDKAAVAGTFVNGHRIAGKHRIVVGDLLQVGPYSALVGADRLEPVPQLDGVRIEASGAYVTVPVKGGDPRVLLNDVWINLEPASLTAVAGPSGAGKSTLMRLLAGQTSPAEGFVAYDGVDLSVCRGAYSALTGYVPQDDIVHGDLTVLEALEFQTSLRLPDEPDQAERYDRVTNALEFVDLIPQAGQLVKTLSGGQRKRVSVATELLSDPPLIFLDEPTSGLDPGLDKRMMLLLRLLADQGRTVVLTTHAISYIDVCDTLILVGPGGHIIYCGPPSNALTWFGVDTLADVFALIDREETSRQAALRVPKPSAHPTSHTVPPADTKTADESESLLNRLWPLILARQSKLLIKRQLLLMRRDPPALAFSLRQGIAVAALAALVAPSSFDWGTTSGSMVLVLSLASVWFGMINSVREFVKERTIWRREHLSGERSEAYVASKVAVLAGLGAVQALSMTLTVALTLHLPSGGLGGPVAIQFFITLLLADLGGMALGLVTSALAPTSDRAQSFVPYLLITQMLLCGVLFPLGSLKMVSYVMPARYAVASLGGVSGLGSGLGPQPATTGLYPTSLSGLVLNWLGLLVLTGIGVAVTGWVLERQARSWTVG